MSSLATTKETKYGEGAFTRELQRFLSTENELKLIRFNTNLIYDAGDHIVRLTPNSFRPRKDVVRELNWMTFLRTYTKDVVQVIGDNPTEIRQFVNSGEEFTVTLLEKINGHHVEHDEWNDPHFERLGKAQGILHRAATEYTGHPEFELLEWNDTPDAAFVKRLPKDDRQLDKVVQRVNRYIAEIPKQPETFGPAHYDIHLGNYMITDDERLVVFDFENACKTHFIDDVAITLFYANQFKATRDQPNFEERFMSAFWKGYQTERPYPEQEIEHIPWFLLNRSLILLGYLIKIYPDGTRTQKQQDYIDLVEAGLQANRVRAIQR